MSAVEFARRCCRPAEFVLEFLSGLSPRDRDTASLIVKEFGGAAERLNCVRHRRKDSAPRYVVIGTSQELMALWGIEWVAPPPTRYPIEPNFFTPISRFKLPEFWRLWMFSLECYMTVRYPFCADFIMGGSARPESIRLGLPDEEGKPDASTGIRPSGNLQPRVGGIPPNLFPTETTSEGWRQLANLATIFGRRAMPG